MKRSKTPEVTRAGRIALLGRPNVGKSTLLNALLGEAIAITSPHPQTTRAAVRGVVTRGGAQFLLVDTPGLHSPRSRLGERMNAAARQAAADADAVVYLLAAPLRASTATTPSEQDVKLLADLPPRPTVLAVNKIDRLETKEALLPFLSSVASSFDAARFEAVVPISAKRADGTDRLLDALVPCLPEQPMLFDPDTLSDQPARFFVAEFVREQVLRQTRQEVPHGVAVIVEVFDETGAVPRIEATVHVARESHKKIVIGAAGRMLKAIGAAARARIERMLDRKVHLRLHVRATPGWMDNDARLRELGYGEDSS
jgi:GTP-binding protein Era